MLTKITVWECQLLKYKDRHINFWFLKANEALKSFKKEFKKSTGKGARSRFLMKSVVIKISSIFKLVDKYPVDHKMLTKS